MEEYVWMLPILFIVHDMEEIMGFGIWKKKNEKMLKEKYPRIAKVYMEYSTEGMTAAVMEEMLLCLLVCVSARITGFYGIWLGIFIAYTLHLLIHMGQSVVVRKYIPALATSILCLPFSLCFLTASIKTLSYPAGEIVLWGLAGTGIVAGNLKLAHSILHAFTRKFVWDKKRSLSYGRPQ